MTTLLWQAIAQAGLCELLLVPHTQARALAQLRCRHDFVTAGSWQRLCTRCGLVVVADGFRE